MNWYTVKMDRRAIEIALADERSDQCEHVAASAAAAYVVRSELDSFGPIDVAVSCKACHQRAEAKREEDPCLCRDCGKTKPRREILEWTPWHFCPRQGDEPVVICRECCVLPRHQERIADDRKSFARDDDDYEWPAAEEDDFD